VYSHTPANHGTASEKRAKKVAFGAKSIR